MPSVPVILHHHSTELRSRGLCLCPGDQRVVGPDDLDVELGADPHGVCVDQLLDHVGAGVLAAVYRRCRGNTHFCVLIPGQLLGQLAERIQAGPQAGLVTAIPARRLVQVVQASSGRRSRGGWRSVPRTRPGVSQLKLRSGFRGPWRALPGPGRATRRSRHVGGRRPSRQPAGPPWP